MSEIKVLALDLDGTLTDSNKQVSTHTKEIIHRAIHEKDIKVVLASGRPTPGIEPVADMLDLASVGGYMLAYNGGEITECSTGQIISSTLVDNSLFKTICEVGHLFPGVAPLTYKYGGIITEFPDNPYVIEEQRCNGIPVYGTEDLYEAIKDDQIVKFLLVGEPSLLPPVKEYLSKAIPSGVSLFLSQPFFLECVPEGIEKAAGLDIILNSLGYTRDNLMACGDGPNDLPMLEAAAVSVAMANAFDEVKEACDFISLSNDEDGVAFAVEKYILN